MTDQTEIDRLKAELQDHIANAPKEPSLRRYKTNDATVEKLGELLRENPNGIMVSRDELVGLLVSWDKIGREGDRAFFLEAWNGTGSFDTDRIGRGNIMIPNLCLSVFGGIQPDKLTAYLEQATNALANDGMLQRFQLLVYPDHQKWEWRDSDPNKEAQELVYKIFEMLAEFDPAAWGASVESGGKQFPFYHFSPDAQEVFIEWSHEFHMLIDQENNAIIQQHLAKYDKLFPALALIFHLVEAAVVGGNHAPVSKEAALRAAAWCEYLESHARRCYGLLLDDGLRSAQALAKHIKEGDLPPDSFKARDVRRNQWSYLTTDEAVQAALDWLEDEHWLHSTANCSKITKLRRDIMAVEDDDQFSICSDLRKQES